MRQNESYKMSYDNDVDVVAMICDASSIILAFDRTRNIKWHSSKIVSSTLDRTNPCNTVALAKSSQRWSVTSRSRTDPLSEISLGPQSKYSSTDFVLKKII